MKLLTRLFYREIIIMEFLQLWHFTRQTYETFRLVSYCCSFICNTKTFYVGRENQKVLWSIVKRRYAYAFRLTVLFERNVRQRRRQTRGWSARPVVERGPSEVPRSQTRRGFRPSTGSGDRVDRRSREADDGHTRAVDIVVTATTCYVIRAVCIRIQMSS